jgi:aspartyl-tRNA(Asn)/glutamyl-tRNA(Gln) amidotransferase subunit C
MPKTSELNVTYVARLARINLDQTEAELFQKQLDDVLKYIGKLANADVIQVETAEGSLSNVLRGDVPRDWFTAEQALTNAPRQANGLFIVPKVVE